MKSTLITTLLGFAAIFANAAPVDDAIKRHPMRRAVAATGTAYYPTALASAASSYGTGAPYPTGTAPVYPASTGVATCSTNGAVVCNGPYQFGICDWGHVRVFQPVAAGTKCIDGQIV